MKIVTDSIEVEIYPEDYRYFHLATAKDLRTFIDTVRIERKRSAGFKAEKNK